MPVLAAPSFAPDPLVADRVLDALADPDITLRDVAEQFDTSIEALTLWMARPDIAARIAAIQAAAVTRVRLIATNFLASAVSTLLSVIDDYREHISRQPVRPTDSHAVAEHRRARDGARRSIQLLNRIARLPLPHADGLAAPVPTAPAAPAAPRGANAPSARRDIPAPAETSAATPATPPTPATPASPLTPSTPSTPNSPNSPIIADAPSPSATLSSPAASSTAPAQPSGQPHPHADRPVIPAAAAKHARAALTFSAGP